jgi:hypothetical protein
MSRRWTNLIIIGFSVTVMQIFIGNGLNFYGLFNPKIYPVFLLLLPRNIKPVYTMLIGFFYGALIDMLCNTYGFGIAASVFICFIKSYILQLIYNKSIEEESEISVKVQGENFVLTYLFIGLFLFHLFYFFIELGELANVFYILFKTILSTLLALILYLIFYMLFFSIPKRK